MFIIYGDDRSGKSDRAMKNIYSELTGYQIFGNPNDQVLKNNMPFNLYRNIRPLQRIQYVVMDKCTCTAVTCVITSGFYDPFVGN